MENPCNVSSKEIWLGIPKYAPLCGTRTAEKYYKGRCLESNLISRQKAVFHSMKAGYSVFVTGFYQTGKKYLCRVFMEWCKTKPGIVLVQKKTDIDLSKRNVLIFADKASFSLQEIEALQDFKNTCGSNGQIVVFARSGCFWKAQLSTRLTKLFPLRNQYRWRRSMVVDTRMYRPYFKSVSHQSGYSDDEFGEDEDEFGEFQSGSSTDRAQECSDYSTD